jgi:glycosyltransferase involved in cell wall biosynthesis
MSEATIETSVDLASELENSPASSIGFDVAPSLDYRQPRHCGGRIAILGTRGIPARHGGFETFAERLALHLVRHDWDVTVYCQDERRGPILEGIWQGIRLVRIAEPRTGALGTMIFDWKSTLHAARERATLLTLGYNTAIFCGWYRLRGKTNLMNMDGLEWQRAKWSLPARAWLYLNERLGCRFAQHLIADHPAIAAHLATRAPTRKITMIPYGADRVIEAPTTPLEPLGLEPGRYVLIVARPEPENSLLEMVYAFSSRPRGVKLVVLGKYEPRTNAYHADVLRAASSEVVFPGAIYDEGTVRALRYHARLYMHGHTVGGTNPALVEALGAGAPVLAHDNVFNRWVAGPEAFYFGDREECAVRLDRLLDDAEELENMRAASYSRHESEFTWERVLSAYENLLVRFSPQDTDDSVV